MEIDNHYYGNLSKIAADKKGNCLRLLQQETKKKSKMKIKVI